jgi:hypothetical protein
MMISGPSDDPSLDGRLFDLTAGPPASTLLQPPGTIPTVRAGPAEQA